MDYLSNSKLTRKDWGNLIRVVADCTRDEMAQMAGVSLSALSNFEANRSNSKLLNYFYNNLISMYNLVDMENFVSESRAFVKLNNYLGGK